MVLAPMQHPVLEPATQTRSGSDPPLFLFVMGDSSRVFITHNWGRVFLECAVALKNDLKLLAVSDPDHDLFRPRVQPSDTGAGVLKPRSGVGIDGQSQEFTDRRPAAGDIPPPRPGR